MKFLLIFSVCMFVGIPLITLAHGDGASFETTVGEYFIDIGYSAPNPLVDEAVLFDFELTQGEEGPAVPFSDVWVRVEAEDGKVVFASGIYNSEFGGPRISYVFPNAGNYTVSARYENEAGPITETSFPITVGAAEDTGAPGEAEPYLFGAGGLVLGLLIASFVKRRKSV